METAFLIISVLVVEFIYDPLISLRDENFIKRSYNNFHLFVKEYIDKKLFIYLLFSFFCIFLTILINGFFYQFIHWTLSFLFSFIVLFYCLKPNEFNEKIDDFKFIIDKEIGVEDKDLIKTLAKEININKLSQKDIYLISKNLFYGSTRNIFSIIFWFLLLGPGGALGYKVLDYFSFTKDIRIDQKSRNDIKDVLGLMEFIPIRLTSLAFAIVGNFESSLLIWKKHKADRSNIYESNIDLVNNIGNSSVQLDKDSNKEDIIEKISYIQTLVARSLLTWLSITMLLILGGFFN